MDMHNSTIIEVSNKYYTNILLMGTLRDIASVLSDFIFNFILMGQTQNDLFG